MHFLLQNVLVLIVLHHLFSVSELFRRIKSSTAKQFWTVDCGLWHPCPTIPSEVTGLPSCPLLRCGTHQRCESHLCYMHQDLVQAVAHKLLWTPCAITRKTGTMLDRTVHITCSSCCCALLYKGGCVGLGGFLFWWDVVRVHAAPTQWGRCFEWIMHASASHGS